MIKVKVRLYATLRRYMPEMAIGQSADVSVPEGATVGSLLDQLGIPRDEMRICYVGGLYSDLERQLRDGDDVALFPPVGGGNGRGEVLMVCPLPLRRDPCAETAPENSTK